MKRISESAAKLLVAALFVSTALPGFQAGEKLNKTRTGLAVEGYDPVAYFEDGKAVKGSQAYEFQWNGATWRFSTAAHREAFTKNPDRYAPQYGGFCAYGVSEGHTAPIDPEAWNIVDGKLYLNYDKQVREDWRKDTRSRIEKADQNWPKLAGK